MHPIKPNHICCIMLRSYYIFKQFLFLFIRFKMSKYIKYEKKKTNKQKQKKNTKISLKQKKRKENRKKETF
jgi:hypothetical protein